MFNKNKKMKEEMKHSSLVVYLDDNNKVHFSTIEDCDKKTISFKISDKELRFIEVLNWNVQENKEDYRLTFDVKNDSDKYKVDEFHEEIKENPSYSSEELSSFFSYCYYKTKKIEDVTPLGSKSKISLVA